MFPPEEVEAARIRVAMKRAARAAAKAAQEVTLKVVRKDKRFGEYCQLWQNGQMLVEAYIWYTSDYKRVSDFIAEAKKYWDIINLPTENDPRYYVRMLAIYQSIGWGGMGCVVEAGKTKQCYTVDDLIEIGFAEPLEKAA